MVRFHAFQGLYLFVAWLMADWVLRPMFDVFLIPRMQIYRIVEIVLLGMSVFMMLKAGQNEAFSLPLFGELAHRSVAEDKARGALYQPGSEGYQAVSRYNQWARPL